MLLNLHLYRIYILSTELNSLYKIHTQLNITKTRIYHNNILKIGIIKYISSDKFSIQKLFSWQHNKIIYYWTDKVLKSFNLFNWDQTSGLRLVITLLLINLLFYHHSQLKIIGMEPLIAFMADWGDDGREIGDAAACPMSRP